MSGTNYHHRFKMYDMMVKEVRKNLDAMDVYFETTHLLLFRRTISRILCVVPAVDL